MSHDRDSTVVRARGLEKRFGRAVAVRALDLELRAGEVFGFLGPNGAGKTTTVKMLLGLLRPSSGEVELFGETLRWGQPRHALAGAIIESPAFYPFLSGRDNLAALARLAGLDERGVDGLLERVGLERAGAKRFSQYSMGMKQRLGIASVLLRDARLVVLDEPTSGLDPVGQREIDRLIRGLGDEGRTVFLSSHQMSEVEAICDRVAIMRGGEKVFEGEVAALERGERFVITVPDFDAAVSILGRVDWVDGVARTDDALLVRAPESRAADLTAALAAAGVYITGMRIERRGIEALYHEVMEAAA